MRSAIVAALLFLSASSALTQTKPAPAAPPLPYDAEAVIVEKFDTVFHYNSDGTGEKTLYMRIKVQSEAGARQWGVLPVAYASANESAQIQSVRALHSDGTSTETPISDAIDMPAPVTQQFPLYSDLKQLQIPVRGLRVGDILEYRVLIQMKNPESPSQFWSHSSFLKEKEAVVLSQTLTLDLPADKYVQVWSPKLKPTITESAGRRVYLWTGSQLKPTHTAKKKADDPPEPPEDKKPLVAWTTFHSWAEVGDWYRNLTAPRAVATDALRAQADEITRQITNPEEQVRALYSFVSGRIRYIGIDFGVGRFQPHPAAEVFANQYGDCKDKDSLLEALLRSKGFNTAPALIGVNIDMVPELPSPSLFNHVITTVTLPSGKLWMDTTAEVAPFQVLVSPLRDKEALVIPSSGPAAIERTPAQTPFPFVDQFEATAELKPDGELNGHVEANFRSDRELLVRAIARNIAPAQWDQGTQYLANHLGFSGTTSNSSFARAEDTTAPMHVSYDYTKKPFGDWNSFRIVPLFPANDLPEKPEKQPSEDIDLGALRTERSISRIRLPETLTANLPDAVHVKTAFATYDKTYKLDGQELTAEKTLVVLQSKLPALSWEQYKKFAKDISLGEESWIQLTAMSANAKGPHAPKGSYANPAAAKLISEAVDFEHAKDWAAALKKLDRAKAIGPGQPYLWSNYAYIEMQQKKIEAAKKHFQQELDLHPDESYVVYLYGGLLYRNGEAGAARTLLSEFLASHPPDRQVALLLASIQSETSLPDAIATLRKADEALPPDHSVWAPLATYLVRNQQNTEAAAIAHKHLEDGQNDPNVLNSAAYILAQANTDLPFAEQKTRQALEILDGETKGASVSEANDRSFERSALLAATWDTLGFILFEESKLDEARDFIEAAWRNRPDREVAEHYAQLQEALGDPKAALRTYELARSIRTPANSSSTQQIDTAIERLKKAGVPSTVNGQGVQILQDERSSKLSFQSPCKSYCSATFRLQLASGSPLEVMRVSGESALDAAIDSIRHLELPHMVPTHSSARILRDAILSCSAGATTCDFVLMPMGNIKAESAAN